jgi:NTP-dependent ternary system trypsin peptidase co-occuring protein
MAYATLRRGLQQLGGGMSTEVVELTLPDGTPVLVRAERVQESMRRSADGNGRGGPADSGAYGPADTGFDGPSDVGRVEYSFELVTRTVRGITGELHKALKAVSPDRVSVEVGFDLALKGNHLIALVVSGGVHASLKVKLEWGGESAGDADDEPPEDGAAASS